MTKGIRKYEIVLAFHVVASWQPKWQTFEKFANRIAGFLQIFDFKFLFPFCIFLFISVKNRDLEEN